ncbi:MAG: hypothetical protein WCF25_13190 [Acidimicrobiales bacterium]
MPTILPTPWAELEPTMQTGDLILFCGSSKESDWIKLVSGGMFSHSTMIYRPDPSQPPWMWQEAPNPIVGDPTIKSPDPLKVLHGGAQLGDALSATQVIRYNYGDIPYYVPINLDPSADLNGPMAAVVAAYEDRPFGSILDMALNYIIGHFYNLSSGEATLFCAQLLGLTFMKIGLLSDMHPANWYSPNSFTYSQAIELPWAMKASFGTPVAIGVPAFAQSATLSDDELASWPAGPMTPLQLPVPPSAPYTSPQ